MLIAEAVSAPALFKPTHVATWWKPSWISARILKHPVWHNGRLERGALIANQIDPLVELLPDLRSLYILVERHGWFGLNHSGYADISLVEDLSVWDELVARDPDIIHLPLGGADFVDDAAFTPLTEKPSHDVIQISCWSRRKRIELYIEAAARLPHVSFLHLGHFENGACADELRYRDECIALAARVGANMIFPFGVANSNDGVPHLKSEINRWINRARVGVLTAMAEGINRFKMECLAADRPILVAADAGTPTAKHINPATGLIYQPTAEALAAAIQEALTLRAEFRPREYVLTHTGQRRSLARLKEALRESCRRTGGWYHFDDIDWDGRNDSLCWGRDGLAAIINAVTRHSRQVPEGLLERTFAEG